LLAIQNALNLRTTSFVNIRVQCKRGPGHVRTTPEHRPPQVRIPSTDLPTADNRQLLPNDRLPTAGDGGLAPGRLPLRPTPTAPGPMETPRYCLRGSPRCSTGRGSLPLWCRTERPVPPMRYLVVRSAGISMMGLYYSSDSSNDSQLQVLVAGSHSRSVP
jgi:hypothetical protein